MGVIDVPNIIRSVRAAAAAKSVRASRPAPPVVIQAADIPIFSALSISPTRAALSGDDTTTPILLLIISPPPLVITKRFVGEATRACSSPAELAPVGPSADLLHPTGV